VESIIIVILFMTVLFVEMEDPLYDREDLSIQHVTKIFYGSIIRPPFFDSFLVVMSQEQGTADDERNDSQLLTAVQSRLKAAQSLTECQRVKWILSENSREKDYTRTDG